MTDSARATAKIARVLADVDGILFTSEKVLTSQAAKALKDLLTSVIAHLSKVLSIPPAQIVTMGDMPNDILMFRKSGFSIAMRNSSDEVKA